MLNCDLLVFDDMNQELYRKCEECSYLAILWNSEDV